MSAPFTLLGAAAAAFAIATVIWVFGSAAGATAAAWATLTVTGTTAVVCFVAARGCRVLITGGEVRDQVAWWTVHRVRCGEIGAVRVRRGPWRTYEMELLDGSSRVLLGAGPVQFPAHLLPDARERDLAAIDAILGDVGS